METKIIETPENKGTVIIEDSSSAQIQSGGTKIIEEQSGGTQIIQNSGTQVIENSDTDDSSKKSSENAASLNIKRGSGVPVGKGVDVFGCEIKKQMETVSGEADLFIAEKDSKTVVFKYYRNSHKPKIAVVEKIKELKNPHIIKLLDYGFYNDRFFEVYEYAKFGSLDKKNTKNGNYKYLPLSEEKVFSLCRDINDAFKEFHSVGIIHRDIKPDNFLVRSENPLDIAIGDFGISSVMDEKEELHKTKTLHHTIGYVPREFFTADYKGIGTELDYYSLGITLWGFATGGNPFADPKTGRERTENFIMRDTAEGRVADDLLSREPKLSGRLQKLIRGLLVTDYEKRWGYSEVERFLNGEDVAVAEQERKKLKVSVAGKMCEDEKDVAETLWNNKDKVDFLTIKKISDALQTIHSYIADDVQKIVQDIDSKDLLEIPILKIVYLLYPDYSFKLEDDYFISNKDDVLEILENAPEIISPAFENLNSVSFTYISLILGEDSTKKIKNIVETERERNKKYFDSSDSLFNLKIISKVKLLISDKPLMPFKSEEYKNISFYELDDLRNPELTEELKDTLLEDVSQNIYEDDFVPWLELKTGKRREEFAKFAALGWKDFCDTVFQSVKEEAK